MDPLSDMLSAIHLDGAIFIDAEFTAPWCVETQFGLQVAMPELLDSECVVFFHLLTEGACHARLAREEESIEVKAGDLLLFPHDDRHVIGSDLRLAARTITNAAPPPEGLLVFNAGGGGEATRFICGYLACDRRASAALLGSLPSMLRISLGDIALQGWLADLLRVGVEESRARRPGSQTLLAKLLGACRHRGAPALCRVAVARAQGMARRLARSFRRARAFAASRRARAQLVGR
jgi:AraC family transcriptional regulator, alkane utilization regulator